VTNFLGVEGTTFFSLNSGDSYGLEIDPTFTETLSFLTWTENSISLNAYYLDCSAGTLEQVDTQALDIKIDDQNEDTTTSLFSYYYSLAAG
jgi:hypothetical protein